MDSLPPPADAPTRILDAAENLIIARGVAALTLEAAAREAEVSKGGVLRFIAGVERAGAVFLAAFHPDPALLAPMRAVIAEMRAAVAADGLPPGHGAAIMAAGDGLFMARLFNLYTPSAAELAEMRAALSVFLGARP